jgi:zinc protease
LTPDFAALSLLETVLGGSFTSRLNQNLREKHGYTYGARAEFQLARAPAPFIAAAAVRSDVTAESLTETLSELAGMRGPLPLDELKKGRALVLQRAVEQYGDGMQTSLLLGELLLNDRPLDLYGTLPAQLDLLDPPQVTQVAHVQFPTDGWTVVIVGDRKQIEAKLRALPIAKSLELRNVDGDPMP